MSRFVLEKITGKFGGFVIDSHDRCGDETVSIEASMIAEVCDYLKKDPECSFEMLKDITCVDRPEEKQRFEVVYHLYSVSKKHRIRLKTNIGEDNPRIPSITSVWRGANWFEREAYDMYGVVFEGHPDLRRILLYPEFEGFPLRKDYPKNREQPLTASRDPDTGIISGQNSCNCEPD